MFWFILMGIVCGCMFTAWLKDELEGFTAFIVSFIINITIFLIGILVSIIVMVSNTNLTETNTYNIAKTDDNKAKIVFKNGSMRIVYEKYDNTNVSKEFYKYLPTIYSTDKESYVEVYTYTCSSIFMYGGSSISNNYILYINKDELDFAKKPLIKIEKE